MVQDLNSFFGTGGSDQCIVLHVHSNRTASKLGHLTSLCSNEVKACVCSLMVWYARAHTLTMSRNLRETESKTVMVPLDCPT